MSFLRTLMIWMLVLSLPADAFASASMSQCKDMQKVMSVVIDHDMAGMGDQMTGHDHTAMMAMTDVAASDMVGMHDHQSMAKAGDSPNKSKSPGCKCGCKCSGNCAVSCAAMLVTIAMNRVTGYAAAPLMLTSSAPRGQAHSAYRYDPLRPPSAVAL